MICPLRYHSVLAHTRVSVLASLCIKRVVHILEDKLCNLVVLHPIIDRLREEKERIEKAYAALEERYRPYEVNLPCLLSCWQKTHYLASFPGLPRFVLWFVFSIIDGNQRRRQLPRSGGGAHVLNVKLWGCASIDNIVHVLYYPWCKHAPPPQAQLQLL